MLYRDWGQLPGKELGKAQAKNKAYFVYPGSSRLYIHASRSAPFPAVYLLLH